MMIRLTMWRLRPTVSPLTLSSCQAIGIWEVLCLEGDTGKVLRVLFPEVSYLDRRSPPEGIPYSYPPLAFLAYVEELLGGDSKVVLIVEEPEPGADLRR
jgi:hypothetical protein